MPYKVIEKKQAESVIQPNVVLREALIFSGMMWGLSRLIVLLGLLVIALVPNPALDQPLPLGWEAFNRWDSEHYEQIATSGYQFKDNGQGYNVAFFPLFPLLIRGAMQLGLSFEVAGTLINNLAFLGALVVLYRWVGERYGRSTARWATASLAWCPFSLFGTVIYTEGLFLLGSTAALRAFDRQQYGWAMFWGALTTAIRPPGLALVATFAIVAWRERREAIAYLTAIFCSAGLLLFMLYCGIQFDQPFAFILAQRGWQSPQEFHGAAWLDLLTTVFLGPANEDESTIVDPWYPLSLVAIAVLGWVLWQLAKRKSSITVPSARQLSRLDYGFCVLAILLWLIGGAPLIEAVMVLGGAFLLWHFRHELGRVALTYGWVSWAIILSTGRTTSADRYAYGVVTVAIAFGLLLSRYPRWGYPSLIFFAILLGNLSVRFAQGLWAG
jgi:Gpi18-like mannosyltransferase